MSWRTSENRSPPARWFPLAAGVVYLAGDYLGNSVIASLPGAPHSDDAVLADFLASQSQVIDAMAVLIAVGGISFGAFAVALRRRLPATAVGEVIAGSGISFATMALLQAVIWMSATGDHSEPHGRALWDLMVLISVLSTLPACILVVATALTLRAHGDGPAWVWDSGLVLSLLFLFPFAAWATLKLLPFWVVGVGVSLFRRKDWGFPTAHLLEARGPA